MCLAVLPGCCCPFPEGIGLARPGFGSRKGYRCGFCEKLLPKASPGLVEPLPGGSKMDVWLVKAWPVRNGGNPSGITYLRREKKLQRRCNHR